MTDQAIPLRLLEGAPARTPTTEHALVESYRRLADVFHEVLGEQSLDALLDRIAAALADLIPHDSLTIYQADEPRRLLLPVLARDSIKGALNIYRLGEDAIFDDDEFELAKRFGDAAALALDNAQIRARLEHQAQTDSLTGLYNHRYFHDRLRSELTRASRVQDAVAVLMLDIDDFKRVNDVHGHGTGDFVLSELAELLRVAVRASDVVCRLGGEEFGVIMPSCSAGDAF